MTDDVITRFANIFQGSRMAYGSEDGGCIRDIGSRDVWADHLSGYAPMGVYPVVARELIDPTHVFFVRWGACDIDYEDIQEAINFHNLLKQVGVPSYIERSRSKGYHVWVFVEEWISAETMRHALLVVRDFLKMEAREIYPKQTTLRAGELGNYLRLPYPGWLAGVGASRRLMLALYEGEWHPMPLEYFLDNVQFADPKDLEKLASRYTPPQPVTANFYREDFDVDDTTHNRIARAALHRISNKLAWHIYNNGPSPGVDRSSTLMRLCNMVAQAGATPQECFSIVWSADLKEWGGKYVNRADGVDIVERMVDQVYSTVARRNDDF